MNEIDNKKNNKILLIKYLLKYFIIPFLILFIPFIFILFTKIKNNENVGSFFLNGLFSIVLISLVIGLLIIKLWFYKKNNE